MTSQKQFLTGWANYPVVEAEVFNPVDEAEVREIVLGNEQVIARGNGKSYGDAALAPRILSTLALNQLVSFDKENGIVECEAGMLFRDLLKIIVPAGWFLRVTPGVKAITVGGAVASDVHGKNHPTEGCFSNALISFELMTATGVVKTCSREQNHELFWQSCGGMGWTGVILLAKFRLLKISAALMLQKTVRASDLDTLFQTFESNTEWPYSAAWVDCTSKNWRGAAFLARHSDASSSTQYLEFKEKARRNIPVFAPSWLLNPLSIRAYNTAYFYSNPHGERSVSLDQYFYPLDSIQNWNRLYGRRGFVQYQFCLPERVALDGIRQVLEIVSKSSDTPFLTVLKKHGERPSEAVHSFPIKGFSLALDFPRTKSIFSLVRQLDERVWYLGGKIYLTKDSCSGPHMGWVDPLGFGEEKFSSLLRERLSRVTSEGL